MGSAAVGNHASTRGIARSQEASVGAGESVAAPQEVAGAAPAVSSGATWRQPAWAGLVGKPLLRVAFVGPSSLLDAFAPGAGVHRLVHEQFVSGPGADAQGALAAAKDFGADVTVVLDPAEFAAQALAALPGMTMGLLPDGLPRESAASAAEALDRVVSFSPALTAVRIGRASIWRAIPPPVSDALFAKPRRSHRALQPMAMGRSTPHREAMLAPVKHHHDLLHVIHGVSGEPLIEFLREYDVGVYVGREPGGVFGWQVGMHLAAGHLLLAESLMPTHGLERGIDYLEIDSPGSIVFALDRIARFPEMYHSVRVRGRLKAEQFRASRIFGRLVHDLVADVVAFGSARRGV